jgi:hypothetical protein
LRFSSKFSIPFICQYAKLRDKTESAFPLCSRQPDETDIFDQCGFIKGEIRWVQKSACQAGREEIDQMVEIMKGDEMIKPKEYDNPAFKPTQAISWSLIVMLGLWILISLVTIVSTYMDIELFGGIDKWTVYTEANGDSLVISLIMLTTYLLTSALFLFWFYRVHKNLPALGVKYLEYTSGWAVSGFIVPLLNLIRPYEVMEEVWNASNPAIMEEGGWRTKNTAGMVNWWWGLYLASWYAARFAFKQPINPESPVSIFMSDGAFALAKLVSITSAVVTIFLIIDIDDRQQEKFAKLKESVKSRNHTAQAAID